MDSSIDANMKVFFQDIQKLEEQVDDLGKQMQRVYRVTKIDEVEAKNEEVKISNRLVKAVKNNTEAVSMLVREIGGEEDDISHSFFYARKYRERLEARKRLQHIRDLSECQQVITEKCPCGNHKGIQFLGSDGKVVDELCPVSWWVMQSRLAFEEKHLGAFTASTPLDKYIRLFKLV
jgi:hypothetical protein